MSQPGWLVEENGEEGEGGGHAGVPVGKSTGVYILYCSLSPRIMIGERGSSRKYHPELKEFLFHD